MSQCDRNNCDSVFKRFKVVEFPVSFVGLSTTRYVDMDVDLTKSIYLKTLCDGKLLIFSEAREKSPSHRAFTISQINHHAIEITFEPKNECITNAKKRKLLDNRFVFDIRLIQIDEVRCCNDELHSEIGRYYISGQYEYCKLTHYPEVIEFGDVILNTRITKYVRVRNESNSIATKINYIRVPGIDIVPQKFTVPPNSSKRLSVTIKPTCMKIRNVLVFEVRNPHNKYDEYQYEGSREHKDGDSNYLTYIIKCKLRVIYKQIKISKEVHVESLHKIIEPDIRYTYINDAEIEEHKKRQKEAFQHLAICKANYAPKTVVEKFCTGKDKCCSDISLISLKGRKNFCKHAKEYIQTYEIFNIVIIPFSIEFGRIALNTYGEGNINIKNNTKYDITIDLFEDECVLYTDEKLKTHNVKLKSFSKTNVTVFCLGYVEGNHRGTFVYAINKKFFRKHPYTLQVGNPTLMIQDKNLKFGMTTSESFITSVPVRIYNYFNIPVRFNWNDLNSDMPFDIIPLSGIIPKHSCKICDIIYVCKPTKSKIHEIDFVSESKPIKIIPIELTIVTRKLAIKFLQPAVTFKDIALNIETVEKVKLENSSREIATFYVLEPLIPGFKIEPMSGTIRPKMVMSFDFIVKISCVLEFAFDVYIKINNKEIIILPVSGNVVEPKIIIHPKNIFMARVPCGMITYVPVTLQNLSTLKSVVEVLNTSDENIFDVYIAQGNEKQRIFKFFIEGGQSKTVFIKVYDIFRREYDMYIPFKINGLLGPPDYNSWTTELQYYIGKFEMQYENNPRVKIKSINKDISYCRITGVITVPWIQLSQDKLEIEYVPSGSNKIEFTMTNISKYYLHVTIQTSKLSPIFSLDVNTEDSQSIINESNIKFELERGKVATLTLNFHPKMHGRFVSTAILFLDKHMTIPYSNLTFIGKRQTPVMIPSTYRLIFPPSYVETNIVRYIKVKIDIETELDSFSCMSKEEANLSVNFMEVEITREDEQLCTILTVELQVCSQTTYARTLMLSINHECGSGCEIEINFCFTYCALTLHSNFLVKPDDNPYPYFPENTETKLYDYMVTCTTFLEKWMFQQGFRRDLYPVIPDSFHVISTALTSQPSTKTKGINVSFLNYIRRIAGPLMKHIRKITAQGADESFKSVHEIHETYREIINLIRSRGANLWTLQAKFLLSYDQFVIFTENIAPKCNTDIIYTKELLENVDLFNRLSKQCWIDLILQSYKVFVMDSCFFDCVCVSSQQRDLTKVLIDWYNEHISLQHIKLRGKHKPKKEITNITTDLSDGIAIISGILYFCPFLSDTFATFCEIEDDTNREGGIINNACLIIEAMNTLRLYFPLISTDLLHPNFLQMLFLSIHLYVTLPMFKPKDTITFNPPLLRSSSRHVAVFPSSQEALIFSYVIINNVRNNFIVEKAPAGDNGKKMFLSVKYIANFVNEESCVLLVHGYNKTRIFDTYVVFLLKGCVGILNPVRKCKVTGPLYRPNKVDILVGSPFTTTATYNVFLTDVEPTVPVSFEDVSKPQFYLRRLNLVDKEITLSGIPKETTGQEITEHKLYLQLICLSTQVGNSWVWFRSEVGEFFVRVTTQPRWDLAIDTLQAKLQTWPMDPCSCGEACECYRTTVLMIPHRNELMVKSLRYALLEFASESMLNIFDKLIETTTGKLILGMLLEEGGTNMPEVQHILRSEIKYRVTSKALIPRLDRVTLAHHTCSMLPLPVTVPAQDKAEKYSVTFTSECGMDIRTYRILFFGSSISASNS